MNKQWKFPTAFKSWGREEQEAIKRVIASDYFTMGSEVEAFEFEFAQYHNRNYAIMVNSGSSANLIAAAALSHGYYENRDVYVPAIAWSTTYAPFIQQGKRLKLIDVDLNTWNIETNAIALYYPGAIVLCPILGNPYSAAGVIPANVGTMPPILEDTCESLGARTVHGRLCGTFGDLSTFSFFHSHQISAIEGGMILTDRLDLAKLCKILRAHGWTRDTNPPTSFEHEYNFTHFGYNVRPLELHAAIAREQLKKLQSFIDWRNYNLLYFNSLKMQHDLPIKMQEMSGTPSPFGIAFTCETTEDRSDLVKALRANDIDCRLPTGGSFKKHPYGSKYADQETPNADLIHDVGLFLGNAPWDISDLVEKAIKVIKGTL